MCGFAGILNFNKRHSVNSRILENISSKLIHRGPDEGNFFTHENFGVTHKRLSIIDLETGLQPMFSEDRNYSIVFNGMIYNYLELKRELEDKGHNFKTDSDTEVLLHIYMEYGKNCLNRLNGMFSFAIHDKNAGSLFLARDRFGIKPLYYYLDSEKIVFSSEIKAILEHPEINRKPDHESIKEYIHFQFITGTSTFFENIRKLEPGMYLNIDSEFNREFHKYYELKPFETTKNEEEITEVLHHLLKDSIKLRLRSDVPVGTTLSGGLDSSLITAVSSLNTQNRLETFTGFYDSHPGFDERRYARLISEKFKTEHNEIHISDKDFTENLETMVYHLDEPVAGPGVIGQYLVNKHASSRVKVLLGGQGADEIGGGYTRHLILFMRTFLKNNLKNGITLEDLIKENSLTIHLKGYEPLVEKYLKNEERSYFSVINRCDHSNLIYDREYINSSSLETSFTLYEKNFNDCNSDSILDKMCLFDFKTLLPALLTVEDRAGMASSIETRVPFLDHRLVEFVFSIPQNIRLKNGIPKYILKKTAQDILPGKITQRTDKMGFPLPLNAWFKNGVLKEFTQDILLSRKSGSRGIFNIENMKKMMNNNKQYDRSLWGALMIELWFREFMDN